MQFITNLASRVWAAVLAFLPSLIGPNRPGHWG